MLRAKGYPVHPLLHALRLLRLWDAVLPDERLGAADQLAPLVRADQRSPKVGVPGAEENEQEATAVMPEGKWKPWHNVLNTVLKKKEGSAG